MHPSSSKSMDVLKKGNWKFHNSGIQNAIRSGIKMTIKQRNIKSSHYLPKIIYNNYTKCAQVLLFSKRSAGNYPAPNLP